MRVWLTTRDRSIYEGKGNIIFLVRLMREKMLTKELSKKRVRELFFDKSDIMNVDSEYLFIVVVFEFACELRNCW